MKMISCNSDKRAARRSTGTSRKLLRWIVAVGTLTTILGCAAIDWENPWDRYYDPNDGTRRGEIRAHFNMHRGRWWNYYARGSLYLACGHYDDAERDLKRAVTKRGYDRRDARTYGMHFMDYFARRELGVTYYFQGQRDPNPASKADLFDQAVKELETSFEQEASARAEFYLSLARGAYWRTTRKDTTRPAVRIKKPIYTRGGTVRFQVAAVDDTSGVEEIQIEKSVGNIEIHTPTIRPKPAAHEVTETVEITFAPEAKMAVVVAKAIDLAGNESQPNSALIVVDTEAPTATFRVAEDATEAEGLVGLSIKAKDDFGLRHIQVGEDAEARVECDGALSYAGTIAGTPQNGRLAVRLADNAGNEVHVHLPIEQTSGQTGQTRAPWPRTTWGFPLAGASPAARTNRGGALAPGPGHVLGLGRAQTALLAGADGSGDEEPEFCWEYWVRPPGSGPDEPKETSEDFFILEGTMLNASDVDEIEVYVNKEPVEHRCNVKIEKGEAFPFYHGVDLEAFAPGDVVTIDVKAYDVNVPTRDRSGRFRDLCCESTLKVEKCDDYRRDLDSVYGLLVLPLPLAPGTGLTAPGLREAGTLYTRRAYELVLKDLRNLCIRTSTGSRSQKGASQKRFRVYDVDQFSGSDTAHGDEWYDLATSAKLKKRVVEDLRTWHTGTELTDDGPIHWSEIDPGMIDLVVCGRVSVFTVENKAEGAEFQIELEVTAVRPPEILTLRRTRKRPAYVPHLEGSAKRRKLLETYSRHMPNACDQAATILGTYLPRLELPIIKVDQHPVRGKKSDLLRMLARMFGGNPEPVPACLMKIGRVPHTSRIELSHVWLYRRDTPKNARVEKVCGGELRGVDSDGSWICPEDPNSCKRVDVHDLVVTK